MLGVKCAPHWCKLRTGAAAIPPRPGPGSARGAALQSWSAAPPTAGRVRRGRLDGYFDVPARTTPGTVPERTIVGAATPSRPYLLSSVT